MTRHDNSNMAGNTGEVEEPESMRGLVVELVWGWMSGKRRKPLVLKSWWLLQAFCGSAALWPSSEQSY